jgi:hypothetical protein
MIFYKVIVKKSEEIMDSFSLVLPRVSEYQLARKGGLGSWGDILEVRGSANGCQPKT